VSRASNEERGNAAASARVGAAMGRVAAPTARVEKSATLIAAMLFSARMTAYQM
jgi:hypothetical protein